MELRKVQVEDIYPDDKNPRKDFGDIKALAASFDLNSLNPGEPVNPPVVVQDGGIYRIIDGERRYRGIKHNKLTSCHVIVCDDMDEANSMIAMLTTDDKQQLSELERSRGVQQMLLLGVDPEKVERVGRMIKGSATNVKRARELVDDAGEDMTLDRMIAIAEFDEAGDDDAVAQLANCSNDEWIALARNIRLDRELEVKAEALREACRAADIPLCDEAPTYEDGYNYYCCDDDTETLAETFTKLPDGSKGWLCEHNYGGPEIRFYRPRTNTNEDPDPEEEAKKLLAKEIEGMIEAGSARRKNWFAEMINVEVWCPAVKKLLLDSFFAHSSTDWQKLPGDVVDEFFDVVCLEDDSHIKYAASGAFAAYLYARHNGELPAYRASFLASVGDRLSDSVIDDINRYREWISLCQADGYELDECDERLNKIIDTAIEEYVSEEEECE